jgi:hypothetical protein
MEDHQTKTKVVYRNDINKLKDSIPKIRHYMLIDLLSNMKPSGKERISKRLVI